MFLFTEGGRHGILLALHASDPGSMPSLSNQRWLWWSLHTSQKRVPATINPPWLWNSWAESSQVQNRGYQWSNKKDLGPTKTLKKLLKNKVSVYSIVLFLLKTLNDFKTKDSRSSETFIVLTMSIIWVFRKFVNPNKTKVHQIVPFGLLDPSSTIWWTKQT